MISMLKKARHHHRRDATGVAHRRNPPGTRPGTLTIDPEAPRPVLGAMAYGPGGMMEAPVTDLEELPAMLERWPVVWLNVDGLGDAAVIARLGEIFALHPLALEDVVNVHQRPKVEHYADTLFIVLRQLTPGEQLHSDQMSMFVGQRFIVTFQEHAGDCFDAVRERIRKDGTRLRERGPDYLAYALIDALVDHYFPILEAYGERLEELQERAFSAPGGDTLRQISSTKRDLLALRRAIWPLREELSALGRETNTRFTEETRLYLRDCYDHSIQLMDMVEILRELSGSLMDIYLSSASNRMNEVMRFLTIIATIFIPLTFIAGIYGMNFNPDTSPLNMPELNWYWGYPFSLLVMALTSGGLLLFFYRKGWLAPPSSGRQRRGEPPG